MNEIMNDQENKERDKKGRFLPGQRPVGREKGTSNKVTSEVRGKIQQLVESYSLDQMKLDLMEIEPGERLKIISGLLDFIIPKLNRTDHALNSEKDIIIVQLPTTLNDHRPIKSKTIQSGLPATTEG